MRQACQELRKELKAETSQIISAKSQEEARIKEPRSGKDYRVEYNQVEVGRTSTGHDKQFDFIIKAM